VRQTWQAGQQREQEIDDDDEIDNDDYYLKDSQERTRQRDQPGDVVNRCADYHD
jgi:hypothetical protein